MIFYASTPAMRTRQIVVDVVVVLWAVLWIRVGMRLHDALQLFAEPGRRIADAGTSLSSNLRQAGDTVSGIPLVGDRVRDPFDRASGAGTTLRDAGLTQIDAVETVATGLSMIMAAVPISIVMLMWLRSRLRFVRRAKEVAELLATSPGVEDLLALRALTSRPPTDVIAACPDAAGRWRARRRDRDTRARGAGTARRGTDGYAAVHQPDVTMLLIGPLGSSTGRGVGH